MKLTKRQLRRIIREMIEDCEEINPYGTGMRVPRESEEHSLIGHT